MDSKLIDMATSYLQSRERAIKFADNPEMEQFCNEQAQRTFQRAIDLGYKEAEWNAAVQKVWNEKERKSSK